MSSRPLLLYAFAKSINAVSLSITHCSLFIILGLICLVHRTNNFAIFHYFSACSMNKYLVTNCSLVNMSYIQQSSMYNQTCTQHLQQCVQDGGESPVLQENITGKPVYQTKVILTKHILIARKIRF